jgi:hypothetical protein
MQLVYAKATVWVTSSVQLREGEAWFADDPLVKAHADLFMDTPKIVRTTLSRREIAERDPAPVEQATRAPGERRTTRRPRKRAAVEAITEAGFTPEKAAEIVSGKGEPGDE